MDPIIGVYLIKLTVRSADPQGSSAIAALTNDTVGEETAAALQSLLAEGGVEAEVNPTSVERTDD